MYEILFLIKFNLGSNFFIRNLKSFRLMIFKFKFKIFIVNVLILGILRIVVNKLDFYI